MEAEITNLVERFERGRLTRRQLIGRLTGLAAAMSAAPAAAALGPKGKNATFKATDVNHVALTVTDIARSRAFYEEHLGLETTRAGSTSSFLSCGTDFLALFKGKVAGLHHYCYSIADYAPDTAVKRLEAVGLKPERRGNRVYFKDPDGIEVQVSAPNAG